MNEEPFDLSNTQCRRMPKYLPCLQSYNIDCHMYESLFEYVKGLYKTKIWLNKQNIFRKQKDSLLYHMISMQITLIKHDILAIGPPEYLVLFCNKKVIIVFRVLCIYIFGFKMNTCRNLCISTKLLVFFPKGEESFLLP